MSFLLSHAGSSHPQLLFSSLSCLPSLPGQGEDKLLLVSEEGWLLPTPRLLLLLHSPLISSLLSSSPSSSLSLPYPASLLSSLLSLLSSGRAPSSSLQEMQHLASSLGISLANCGREREARREDHQRPVTLRMAYRPDQASQAKPSEASNKEVFSKTDFQPAPANLQVFNTREEGFGQWAGFQGQELAAEPETAKVEKEDCLPQEIFMVAEEQMELPVPAQNVFLEGDGVSEPIWEDLQNHTSQIIDETDVAEDITNIPTEWPCTFCPKKFEKENFLKNHIICKHVTQNSTTEWDNFQSQVDSLLVESNGVDDTFEVALDRIDEWHCTFCPKKFEKENFLQNHIINKHRGPPAPEYAIQMAKLDAFKKQDELLEEESSGVGSSADLTHEVAINVIDEWSCTLCPKKFERETFLQNHITNKHTEADATEQAGTEWPCTVCPKKFSAEEHLMNHYAKMHNLKNGPKKAYQCTHCKDSYSTISDFNNHKITHLTKCTVCGKEMYQKSIEMHMKVKHS